MLNLFRMNVYRAVRAKITYIVPAVLLAIIGLVFGVNILVERVVNLPGEVQPALTGHSFFDIAISALSGGFLPVMVAVFTFIFFATERSTGYEKNLIGCYDNKWNLVGAQTLVVACYTAILLLISVFFGFVFTWLGYSNITYEGVGAFLGYAGVCFLETVAYMMILMTLDSIWRKSVLVMIIGVLYAMYSSLVYQLVNLIVFRLTDNPFNVAEYTVLGGVLSLNITSEAKAFARSALIAFAVIVGFFFLNQLAKRNDEMK